MRFYSIRLYNRLAEYCGTTTLALMDDEDVSDFFGPLDKATSISKEEFMANPAFYRQFSDRAKEAWNKAR